jgi:hypothetical protein
MNIESNYFNLNSCLMLKHLSLSRIELTFISGLRRDVVVICDLLGNYTASCVIIYRRFGTTCRSHLQGVKIPKRRVVIIYRRFGTTCRSHLQGSRFQSVVW